jgi:hypothetical protein
MASNPEEPWGDVGQRTKMCSLLLRTISRTTLEIRHGLRTLFDDFEQSPLATAELPFGKPHGLHGCAVATGIKLLGLRPIFQREKSVAYSANLASGGIRLQGWRQENSQQENPLWFGRFFSAIMRRSTSDRTLASTI